MRRTPHGKKAESVIKIIKGKSNRRIFQRNIPKKVWDFGVVWEAEIYYRTAGKNECPALERFTVDIIDISEYMEFEFYDLVCFWNNQLDDIKPIFGRCLYVSHRVVSALCYWILSEKRKVLPRTTVQQLTAE